MDANTLNNRLITRIEDVCLHLFPEGKHKGSEYLIGDIRGNAGNSLKICTKGAKTGFWSDFSENDSELKGRSLVKLWRNARGLDWRQAKKEIMDFLGVRDNYRPKKPSRV